MLHFTRSGQSPLTNSVRILKIFPDSDNAIQLDANWLLASSSTFLSAGDEPTAHVKHASFFAAAGGYRLVTIADIWQWILLLCS